MTLHLSSYIGLEQFLAWGHIWADIVKGAYIIVMPTAIPGVVHFLMMIEADIGEPLIYAAVLAVLLGYRVVVWARRPAPRSVRHGKKTQAA